VNVAVFLLAAVYAVVSTFGAWTVARRKPRLTFLFMTAASLLMVAGVMVFYRVEGSYVVMAAGAVTASLASYWNARAVLGTFIPINHAVRLVLGALLVTVSFVLWG
jgi:drug/metabolite transporter superfamily protein YnfA